MPIVRVTEHAYTAILAKGLDLNLHPNPATKAPDGSRVIELSPDTMDRLYRQRHMGESLSDVILRLCSPKQ